MENGSDDSAKGECCPICLRMLNEEVIGTPESCDHHFCLECIEEWAKHCNTCPNDRSVFHIIFVRNSIGGNILRKVEVGDVALQHSDDEDPIDTTCCEVCGLPHDEATLLLCDGCDRGYHLGCLTPALDSVPLDDWFCPTCEPEQPSNQPSTSNARNGIVSIPRTMANSRIMGRVNRAILSSDSEDDDENIEVDEASSDIDERKESISADAASFPPTSKKVRSRTKRKTVRRRKTKAKRSTSRRTRTRKSVLKQRWQHNTKKSKTSKQRLADKLGITAPPAGCSLPLLKSRVSSVPADSTGGDCELSVFGDTEGIRVTRQPVKKPSKIVMNFTSQKKPNPKEISSNNMSSSTDLLSSILGDQSLLASSSKDIQIGIDGKLKLKPSASSPSLTSIPLPSAAVPHRSESASKHNYLSTQSTNHSSASNKTFSAKDSLTNEKAVGLPACSSSSNKATLVRCDDNSSLVKELGLIPAAPAVNPDLQVVSVCPAVVKKEGRKVYDSRRREEIRAEYIKRYGEVTANGEESCESDGEVVVLTPPPQTPESLVVLTSDSEDERKNRRKPKNSSRVKGRQVYEINSDSNTSRNRSRSNSRRRRSRSRSRRRRSRSRDRYRSRSKRRRSRSKRRTSSERHRNKARNRSGSRSKLQRSRSRDLRRISEKDRHGRDRRQSPHKSHVSKSPKPTRRDKSRRSRSASIRRRHTSSSTKRDSSPVKRRKRKASASKSRSKERKTTSSDRANSYHSPSPRQSTKPGVKRARKVSVSANTLGSELEKNYRRMHGADDRSRSPTPPSEMPKEVADKPKTKKKSKSENKKKKKQKKISKHHVDGGESHSKKKKKHKEKKTSGKIKDKRLVESPKSEGAHFGDGESKSPSPTHADHDSTSASSRSFDSKAHELITDFVLEKDTEQIYSLQSEDESSPKEMVIDTASDHKPSPKPIDSPTKTKPAATDTSFPVAAAADSTVMSEQYEDESSKQEVEESQSPYNPPHPASDSGSDNMGGLKIDPELELRTEEQAKQIIELLKNEVAEPDIAPPAQPPRSVSQKPLVVEWLVQRLGESSTESPARDQSANKKDDKEPVPTTSQSAVEIQDLPASATELSNKQLMDKMVSQERIADEIKIILKPYYCKGSINKDEYKNIMRNCVTKIYQKGQGKVNPLKIKEFVEKYVCSLIYRRKN